MTKQIKLDSKAARLKLSVRRKPYTNRIAPGVRLCYRRNDGPFGSWSVLGDGGRWLKRIGSADDLEPANGVDVLDYWQACERARNLASGGGGGPDTRAGAPGTYNPDPEAPAAQPHNPP